MPSPEERAWIETLRLDVRRRGVAPVARELRLSRNTLAAVLADVAREGTVLLVADRLRRRAEVRA